MEKTKAFIKNNYRYILPIIHIIASFFYERFFFEWNTDMPKLTSVPIADSVSNTFEFVMTYMLSKLISIVLIWLVWKLIFAMIRAEIPIKTTVLFGCLFVVLCVLCLVEWPQSIIGGGGSDHMVTYMYAKAFIPYYWHSIYTSCLYAGCLMIAPTPFVLPIIQCLAAVSVLGYIYDLLEKYSAKTGRFRWIKYITFAAVISPQFIDCITNTWRSCLHAMLALFFFARIIRSVVLDEEKSIKNLVTVMLIGVALSVWRSEGIIYGILGFMSMLIWGYGYRLKRTVIWMMAFAAAFFLFGRPSSVGEKKYYGNDYIKVCFVNPLSNIFRASDSNLSYEGADSDIDAVEAVVPVSVLQQYSYLGYLSNNYSKGFEDIDQTGATEAESGAFMKAVVRILLHNPKTYAKAQLNLLFETFKFPRRFYVEAYHGAMEENNGFPMTMWEQGERELKAEPGVQAWIDHPVKNKVMQTVNRFRYAYEHLWTGRGIINLSFIGFLILIAADITIVIAEIVNIFRKKRENLFWGLIALSLLGVLAATIIMMPTPFITYFYGFIYCSFMLGAFYAAVRFGKKRSS